MKTLVSSTPEIIEQVEKSSPSRPTDDSEGKPMKTPTRALVRSLRAEGMSLRKIYLTLKEQGYVSASGKPLSTSSIYQWLRPDARAIDGETTELIKIVLGSGLSADKKNRIIQEILS